MRRINQRCSYYACILVEAVLKKKLLDERQIFLIRENYFEESQLY